MHVARVWLLTCMFAHLLNKSYTIQLNYVCRIAKEEFACCIADMNIYKFRLRCEIYLLDIKLQPWPNGINSRLILFMYSRAARICLATPSAKKHVNGKKPLLALQITPRGNSLSNKYTERLVELYRADGVR
jgi:hypothetical protein